MTVFALSLFLKMSDRMVNVFEELILSNDPSNIEQLANIATYVLATVLLYYVLLY